MTAGRSPDLAAISARHRQSKQADPEQPNGWCTEDGQPWPCDAAVLVAEVREYQRRVRDFAATWHAAYGHDGKVDDCGWSTCLGLLTGEIRRGAALAGEPQP